jgi:hypothetical protein
MFYSRINSTNFGIVGGGGGFTDSLIEKIEKKP